MNITHTVVRPIERARQRGSHWLGVCGVCALLTVTSPSRAADFLSCPLMFRFRTVDRLPEPSSPDAVSPPDSSDPRGQYDGLNSAVRSLIAPHSSGKSGSRVPDSSCAAGTPFSDITRSPMMRKASRMCVNRHFRKASS